MATSAASLSADERARAEDYLNDKIQVSADLENLDALLSSLRAQHELQQKQLSEAQKVLSDATKARDDHVEALRQRAETFNEQQADIDQRLKEITQSETSDQAVQKFETSMEKLQKLEISTGYVELLQEVEELSKESLQIIESTPLLALKPYARLRDIVLALRNAQPAAEGAAPHLIDHAEQLALALKKQIKDNFNGRLQSTLEKMKWPSKSLVLTDDLIAEWTNHVELLLELQIPELEQRGSGPESPAVSPPILFPLEVMVHPLELRFKYHFSGDKPTNKLDKPEYFLSHILDLVNNESGFFAQYLQPILDKKSQAVKPELAWNFFDASHAFITALLPIIRSKISTFLPQISNYPQLLSHFVHEVMKFDNEICETWNYLPDPYSNDRWEGMAWEVLTNQGWFDRWLQVEKDFALARYKEIIDAADSGHIDYDGVEHVASKPTKAAIRVNDLLETITERYQPLTSFGQKLRFLIDIQITIFDQFHERLHSALEAYLAMTSALGRTVQGADGQASVEGVAGLERLCRVFGSAEYLEKKMQDWSNDVFFVELWSELQERVRQNKDNGQNVAGTMSVADVASRTSQAVAENHAHGKDSKSEGALFDETASAYSRLRLRSEAIITSTLISNTISALKPYSRTATWATLSASSSSPETLIPPSADLAAATRTLSTNIAFLSRALGIAPLRRIVRQLLLSIQSFIWDNVLSRHSFSDAGASQMTSDINHLCDVIDMAVGHAGRRGDSERGMKKLYEGLVLLSLSAHTTDSKLPGETGEGQQQPLETGEEAQLSLWEVEKRLFKDNESARAVLAELKIEILTEAESRTVVERRVEIGSQ
ncbi:hypothetical protein ASPZODRAFT_431789 [Penicilliopsis zonata CBS 506.65]|uniref:RINT-1 family protein n=1 Tax=Penicilliopsis zonata CBS 506.65 TaxID=1073090 RepID=A0A1L9SWR3_9EURO|nr:hypothetical protein ASPZODRAFT_431789 [Penicilliopsis zonata CBS 506.65]OJJ51606.1 hypothetical protein ASPZODRAFT_431789 [Penicilliopsis zonata CBS 506.65]